MTLSPKIIQTRPVAAWRGLTKQFTACASAQREGVETRGAPLNPCVCSSTGMTGRPSACARRHESYLGGLSRRLREPSFPLFMVATGRIGHTSDRAQG